MFSSYFLSNYLNVKNDFLIASANFLTALLCDVEILLQSPSAWNNISACKSSRPLPSVLATELILFIVWINLAQFLL